MACTGGHLGNVVALVEAGADVTKQDIGGSSALSWAIEGGNEKIVGYLIRLENVSDLIEQDGLQDFCLLMQDLLLSRACSLGNPSIVRMLLDHVFVKTPRPLVLACIAGHTEVIKVLLASKNDLTTFKDAARKAALSYNHQNCFNILKD